MNGPPVELGEVVSESPWQAAHRYQGFKVLVVLRDAGHVVLGRFTLVHHVEIEVRIVVRTGGLEEISENTFETTVTRRSEAQVVRCVGRTIWN